MDLTPSNSSNNRISKFVAPHSLMGLYPYDDFLMLADDFGKAFKAKEKAYFIYLQLDQFPEIRNVLGDKYTEHVLAITGERLQKAMNNRGFATHIEDGFFGLFLLDRCLEKPIKLLMDEIIEVLGLSIFAYDQEIFVTCSYGVSVFPKHGNTSKDCLTKAKAALNQKNTMVVRDLRVEYNDKITRKMRDDFRTEMSLRKGLEQEQFELFYQPQVDAMSGELIGLEGLIRWQHPEEGVKMPGTFIELAEATGLIFPLGEWVIEQAFRRLEIWKKQGWETLTISINISSRHFLDPSLQHFLAARLQKYDVNAQQLIVEITEDVAIEDLEKAKQQILAIRAYGFQVSIDDFGTGFSAFHYLQHFPVQEIKIDRQFIQDITYNDMSVKIAKSIIELANMLKLKVVCEGVETEEQYKILQQIGCPILQGYYFSKPMRYQDVWDWWENKKT
ncbi:hypothetical protein J14TS2_12550 [Bacillus sp. J14TS2]|uniref:putative bifunctional diguanylate cyclase/phosphodiesterase n=1 Tax=Bacillus sp. J14TS2 TaxID=2807188 RepID=UPI001B175FFD|nr:GGDEF domain-containing phosphodiesterase [Bacillus sp. J14TS2]GIN70780.1 hypothetical protein J14TS2_12550 [Bacillus sp. J14TS2]